MQEESRTSDRTGQPGVESAIGRDRTEDELPREMGTNRGGSTSPPVGGSASSRGTSSGMSSNQGVNAGSPTAQAQQIVGGVAQQVREQATTRVSNQMERASESLDSVASAIRSVSGELREQDQGFVAGYADRLAEQADRAASYLRNRDLGTLVADAERFVRNQPTVAVGGAFALGLLAARFLKSSSRSSADEGSFRQGSRFNQNAGRFGTDVAGERTAEDHSRPAYGTPQASGVTGEANRPY